MAKITDEHALEAWLKEVPAEFACVLAARAALRVAPVLGQALGEEEEERRHALIMPGFRAMAVANFAGAWPTRLAEVRADIRNAGREAGEAVAEIVNAARMNVFEAKDAIVVLRPIADTVAEGSASPGRTRRACRCRISSSAPMPSSWAGRWLQWTRPDSRRTSRRCSC